MDLGLQTVDADEHPQNSCLLPIILMGMIVFGSYYCPHRLSVLNATDDELIYDYLINGASYWECHQEYNTMDAQELIYHQDIIEQQHRRLRA